MNTELFVNNTIIMNAPAIKVWKVLTNTEWTTEWVKDWFPNLALLESDWNPGSAVIWKAPQGAIIAEGVVNEVQPFTTLKYSFKAKDNESQENILYELHEREGSTTLYVSIGNFADTPEHKASYKKTLEYWDRSLPLIKELSESI